MSNNNLDKIGISSLTSQDPDEQFVLDVIKSAKIESIGNLIEALRTQESKSAVLIRTLERYKQNYEKIEKK